VLVEKLLLLAAASPDFLVLAKESGCSCGCFRVDRLDELARMLMGDLRAAAVLRCVDAARRKHDEVPAATVALLVLLLTDDALDDKKVEAADATVRCIVFLKSKDAAERCAKTLPALFFVSVVSAGKRERIEEPPDVTVADAYIDV
jgi:hypothetical protein